MPFPLSTRSRYSNRLRLARAQARGGQSIWNDSTSSFRYPCLVHDFSHITTCMDYAFIQLVLEPTSYSVVSPTIVGSFAIYSLTCVRFQSLRVLGKSLIYPSLYRIDRMMCFWISSRNISRASLEYIPIL